MAGTTPPRAARSRQAAYGPELRHRTLASLKPEVSQALDSLLAELSTAEDAKVLRSAAAGLRRSPADFLPYRGRPASVTAAAADAQRSAGPAAQVQLAGSGDRPADAAAAGSSRRGRPARPPPSGRSCALCQAAGRPGSTSHYLSRCRYLPKADRRFLVTGARLIAIANDEEDGEEDDFEPASLDSPEDSHVGTDPCDPARRVQPQPSPYLPVYCGVNPLRVTLDTGAEVNLIHASVAAATDCPVSKSHQKAYQADGHSPLAVVGETTLSLSRGDHVLTLQALVVNDLDVDVLAGTPFMSTNDVSVRPAERSVSIGERVVFRYDGVTHDPASSSARRVQCLVRSPPSPVTLWPGEYVELAVPDMDSDGPVSVEPWMSPVGEMDVTPWPHPTVSSVVAGKLRVPNNTDSPIVLKKNAHVCKVYAVSSPPPSGEASPLPPPAPASSSATTLVSIDPHGLLSDAVRAEFVATISDHASVFDPAFRGYNGAVGPIQGVVNVGAVEPPQRKGRLPQYNRQRLTELQTKFDELESLGVFQKPEDLGILVEHVHPSFLVNKASGGTRLVTDFTAVGRYCKPQPSLLPDVESTLRTIGGWKYLIVSDLTKAYFQVPLSRNSMKYCGVVTPYKGVRVYTRCAMCLPGSESALEELMCRVLGDLIQEGHVAKIADNLFCGGATPEEALQAWRSVLQALDRSDLRLSAAKTVICPSSASILGWIWSEGKLSASPHRISTLTTCAPPRTVKNMRSFIGAYKVLGRVIQGAATLLTPLDGACAGRESSALIHWSDELRAAFSRAQSALKDHRSITLPRPTDELWIVTDGSSKAHGIGATLYVSRGDRTLLAGFFSAQLRKHQVRWLPCEIEALGIAAAVKHFAPYIAQSTSAINVLTDSKPCVQAFEKLGRGEFSASPRVTTFLSTISWYSLTVRHLAGAANLPSDFASRERSGLPRCRLSGMLLRVASGRGLCSSRSLFLTS